MQNSPKPVAKVNTNNNMASRSRHPHASSMSSPRRGSGMKSFRATVGQDISNNLLIYENDPNNIQAIPPFQSPTNTASLPSSPPQQQSQQHQQVPANSTIRMRNFPEASRRSFSARSMTMTDAALAAIAFENANESNNNKNNTNGNKLINDRNVIKDNEDEHENAFIEKETPSKSLICTMCYNGMDVLFTTTSKQRVLVVCVRTRVPFQYLDLPEASTAESTKFESNTIVSIVGNTLTGLILVALSNGDIHTFIPREAPVKDKENKEGQLTSIPANHEMNINHPQTTSDPKNDPNTITVERRNDNRMKHIHHQNLSSNTIRAAAFGRFRWCSEQIIHCSRFFESKSNQQDQDCSDNSDKSSKQTTNIQHGQKLNLVRKQTISDNTDTPNQDNGSNNETFNCIHISCCRVNKVLVAYNDQMAVFNVNVAPYLHSGAAAKILTEAELLWITQLHKQILHAQLSGDGNAIAVVVKGEGEGVPFPFGVRTFLRDKEDGSFVLRKKQRSADGHANNTLFPTTDRPDSKIDSGSTIIDKTVFLSRKHKSRTLAVGVVYKPGRFLSHSKPVTRISWRGGSSVHSADDSIATDGNDLLLTHCTEDSSMRIFSQGDMKQLMQWNTPPGSRADWIYGINAANLGDLHTNKKEKEAADEDGLWNNSSTMSRIGSSGFLDSMEETAGASQVLPHHPIPSTSAGAWIAELTFRGAYPALRLSRLTYINSGGKKFQPAHFESVAAILPAGALASSAMLKGEEQNFSVQGIWPVWNPWTRGSSSGIGGSHSPPSELRIVASHAGEDRVVVLEFPLWGDRDFGAMEFGAPLKYVLALSDLKVQNDFKNENNTVNQFCKPVCLEFESSRLVAEITPDKQSVNLSWHREGSMSVIQSIANNQSSPTAPLNLEPSTSSEAKDSESSIKQYIDVSMTPLPLALPPIRNQCNQGDIAHLRWWPDENFGGPPRLLFLNSKGTLLLFEMPPPWSALEPPMPVALSEEATEKSVVSEIEIHDNTTLSASEDKVEDQQNPTQEYEVLIKPHPDFGIGLRLEAQADGLPAIAGSFKKHPLSGGRLPAEKSGMIVLGDELFEVNNVSLEGASFDEIINIVRKVGAESDGKLWMKFRPGKERVRLMRRGFDSFMRTKNSDDFSDSSASSVGSNSKRRNILQLSKSNITNYSDDSDGNASIATMMVGAEAEIQQEFCRLVAMADSVLPGKISAMVLLPWHYGTGAPNPLIIRGTALIVTCSGRTLTASRLEVTNDLNPKNSRHYIIGKVDIDDNQAEESANIESLTVVKTATIGWCLAACDSLGKVTLVFIYVEDMQSKNKGKKDRNNDPPYRASFRQSYIFRCNSKATRSLQLSSYLLRAYSVQLLATMPKSEECSQVTVWLAIPRAHGTKLDEKPTDYGTITVSINPHDTILDFKWLPSGKLDAFPWLVTFSRRSVIVHQRAGTELRWIAVIELKYPSIMGSSPHLHKIKPSGSDNNNILYEGILSPADAYPHLIQTLRNLIESCDEYEHLRSDWHPDSIISFICTESMGADKAMKKNVRGLFTWLSQWMSPDSSARPQWNAHFNLEIAPLKVVQNNTKYEEEKIEEPKKEDVETAASLFSNFSLSSQKKNKGQLQGNLPSEAEMLMFELQTSLRDHHTRLAKLQKAYMTRTSKKSMEFVLTMSHAGEVEEKKSESGEIPVPLKNLNEDEILFLWATGNMIAKLPNFSKLDASAQLSLYSLSLLRTLENFHYDKDDDNTAYSGRNTQSFSASYESGLSPPLGIASGACLSALLSNTQSTLLSSSRIPNSKLDWSTARAIRLPFWLRDDDELCRIAEEIGQHLFKSTKNVMECALFYIAMRKTLKLQTMARADPRDSGQKLYKFLSNFDFSSARGRKAAEKNAFSLLRKRQYGVAAAFFLLPEPPMLTTALEVIVTQMEDLTLAFFIARLIEKNGKNGGGTGGLGLAIGNIGLKGFGGTYGVPQNNERKEKGFTDWAPELGPVTKNVLEQRGLDMAKNDPCFKATILIWLSKPIEAARCLSGSSKISKEVANDNSDVIVPPSFDQFSFGTKNVNILPCLSPPINDSTLSFERVIIKSNILISFHAAPFLLKVMKSDKRLLWSSALNVSRALCRRGLELSSVQMLLQYTNSSDFEEENDKMDSLKNKDESSPSAFKSRDASPSKANPTQSSIFDSFDTAPQKPKPIQSSIFDSFETAPPQPKTTPAQSSIFDSFDTAPQKPKPTPTQSSIFDSFNTAPSIISTEQSSQNDMSSSIFDSFTIAPRKPKNVSLDSTNETGELSSTTYNSFNTPVNNRATSHTSEISSSIFDSFDSNGTTQKPHVTVNLQAKTSISKKNSKEDENTMHFSLPLPPLWMEWREHNLAIAVARRLIREMARVVAKFHGDHEVPLTQFLSDNDFLLAPAAATEVFQNHCEGDVLIRSVQDCLDELCKTCHLEAVAVVEQALLLLGCPGSPQRIIFAVLLHKLMDRADLAEDVVRDAAHSQMQMCESFAFANDDLVHKHDTIFHRSSLIVRRKAAQVSWQLELCLWLHRGGLLPLSGIAHKETIIAVRIGFLIASWGIRHEILESLIKCSPDCAQDAEQGRQLWTSMKVMNELDDHVDKRHISGSGGWEFLVDCKRDEATNLLREKKSGSFLLRPHPEDHGVFTLSFKTNLIPSVENDKAIANSSNTRPVSPDDVVQHAIIRLSDSGFRCGSFGPFPSLIKLLQEVSSSLPFRLLFDEPPAQGIIKDQGSQPSPNAFLLRKLALYTRSDYFSLLKKDEDGADSNLNSQLTSESPKEDDTKSLHSKNKEEEAGMLFSLQKRFGMFSQLLVLSEIRKQLSAIAIADFEDPPVAVSTWHHEEVNAAILDDGIPNNVMVNGTNPDYTMEENYDYVEEDMHGVASRMLRPLLQWCHKLEASIVPILAPCPTDLLQISESLPVDVDVSETAIEAAYLGSSIDGGDALIRCMIQPGSGVEFRTLRVGESNNSAIVVLFSKTEAISWLVSSGSEKTENDAAERLKRMAKRRVIEEIPFADLCASNHGKHFALGTSNNNNGLKDEIRYRFVDPWEVEVLESKRGEAKGASLGRERMLSFNLGTVARSCEEIQRNLGGPQLLSLWSTAKGGIFLTKAIASVHPPWDRDVGADLQVMNGAVVEPSPFLLSLKKRLYRNAIFRLLRVPQRFLALVQVELLDLKNLTAPGGSPPLTAFALLRLKRTGSTAPLTLKARTLDSASTRPKRISRSSGPNAPASWGTLVRFRFTLPEDVSCDCVSYDSDREALFKGPPSVLQISVYEKKFMSDLLLGGANVKLDALNSGGQLEEWVPLRSNKDSITW